MRARGTKVNGEMMGLVVPAAGRRIGGLTSNGVCSQAATRQLTEKKNFFLPFYYVQET